MTPLYPQKLALTSPTGGGRSVGIVRSRTKGHGVICSKNTLIHRLTTGGNYVEIVSWTQKSLAMMKRIEQIYFPPVADISEFSSTVQAEIELGTLPIRIYGTLYHIR